MKQLAINFFYYLPESLLMLLVALSIIGIKLSPKRLTSTWLLFFTLTTVVRYMFFQTGFHTILIVIILMTTLKCLTRASFLAAVIDCFTSFLLLLMGEFCFLLPFMKLMKISINNFLSNVYFYIFGGYLSDIFLVSLLIIHKLTGYTLYTSPGGQGGNTSAIN